MNSVLPRETGAALAGKMAILFPNSRSCRASRLSAKYGLALRVPLGGLFGDGASAFLLRRADGAGQGYQLGDFLFGCAGQYAAAIQVSDTREGGLDVKFDGEGLSRAAITRMEKVLAAVELRSGIPRDSVGSFATHQPNPRLVALLAKQCAVSPKKFPPVARTCGNLGSSTCGAALHAALQGDSNREPAKRQPIFLASLGPGLLFGGGWLTPSDWTHTSASRSV